VEEHFERFARHFGKGAPMMRQILQLWEDTVEGQEPFRTAGIYLMEHVDKEEVYQLFERALRKADTALTRNNVRMMYLSFRYSDLVTREPFITKVIKPLSYEDKTGELAYMGTHFDSFFAHHTGLGIALPIANRTEADAPNEWYRFE
jgi:hypothetical protein